MLLEGIETLLVLAREKTMSRTGSLLYISQSAVSKRIANLEKKLGKKLIEPDGRQVKLTAEGQALVNNIAPSFTELQGRIYDQQPLASDAQIRLDCSETLVAGYLNKALTHYYHQNRHLTITTNHTPRIVERVQAGNATLGFCAGYLPPHHGLEVQHLFDEPFVVINKTPLRSAPKELLTNDLTNPANTYQLRSLQKAGITPIMEMDSYTATAQLALAGMAAAIVPLSVVKTLNIEMQYCFDQFDFLTRLHRPIQLCYRINSGRSPRVQTLIETIADAVAKAV